jgi:hypothetical protein
MKAKVKIKGMSKLYWKIAGFRKNFEKAEKRAVTMGGLVLKSRIQEEMTHSTPYTGTPYGKKSNPGGINLSQIAPLKAYAIRIRTGRLLMALTGKLGKIGDDWVYYVGMDDDKMPYYGEYVFKGTSIMHARDPVSAMYNDKQTQKEIIKVIERELRKF